MTIKEDQLGANVRKILEMAVGRTIGYRSWGHYFEATAFHISEGYAIRWDLNYNATHRDTSRVILRGMLAEERDKKEELRYIEALNDHEKTKAELTQKALEHADLLIVYYQLKEQDKKIEEFKEWLETTKVIAGRTQMYVADTSYRRGKKDMCIAAQEKMKELGL